jgi:peptidyl-prolyl cis-trans isomerase C
MFKEPLLVFLLLGGAMFLLFQQLSNDPMPDSTKIVVTEGRIEALSLGFAKVWQRSPSAEELDHLIQNYIREEILYREALAMGLDRDDSIVRRRMRQKMEFISEDLAKSNVPEEEELQAYLAAHQEKYRPPSIFSFRQIYFNSSERGQAAHTNAMTLLATLQKPAGKDVDVETLGDSLMLKQIFKRETERDIARDLGSQFLQSLRNLPTGSWQGPVRSGFGLHLVYIDERIDGKVPVLKDVREAVLRDWASVKRKQTNEAFYEALRSRYTVTVKGAPNRSKASEGAEKVSMATALQ